MPPMKYELGSYIPEDDILHSHRRENHKSLLICVMSNEIGSNSDFLPSMIG
jgi:hypothetical protein